MEAKPKKRNEAGPSTEDGDNYDPHIHREVSNPTKNVETFAHILKGSFGTGVLAMPEAFKMAGLLNGCIFTLVLGFLCTYGIHLLIRAQYVLCKRRKVPVLNYKESMRGAILSGPKTFHCLANCFAVTVDALQIIFEIGICCCYVTFVAANVKEVIGDYLPKKVSIEDHILFLTVPFMLTFLISDLKILAPFSLVSNAITMGCFAMVLYYVLEDLPSISERPLFAPFAKFPLFLGITQYAIEPIGLIVTLENNMKTLKNFVGWFGVLNTSMFCITITHLAIVFFGFWRYGDAIEPSITLNFPKKEMLAKVIQGAYSVAIFLSYGLQGFVPIDIMWNGYLAKKFVNKQNQRFYKYMLRISTVLFTIMFAITIPLLGLVTSLLGAFCLSFLGYIFPAIMDICVKYPNNLGYMKWIIVKDVLFILIGVLILVIGTYTTSSEIVRQLTKRPQEKCISFVSCFRT